MIPLLPQQIDFWRLPIRPLSEGRYREYFLGLSIEERVLHDAFYFSADRLRHLLTRFFLRRVMAAYLNQDAGRLEFSQNTYGRPALSGHQNYIALDFNVAHNEDYIVCAVSRNGRVGVDIENYRKPCNLALAEDFFAHQELAQLLARNDTQRDKHFCELWTLKESFIKAVGKGMAIPLDAFYFQFDEDSHAFSDPEKHGESRSWQFVSWESDNKNIVSISVSWDLPSPPAATLRLNLLEPEAIPLDVASFYQNNLQSVQLSNLTHIHPK